MASGASLLGTTAKFASTTQLLPRSVR
jgi:DNA processing protein